MPRLALPGPRRHRTTVVLSKRRLARAPPPGPTAAQTTRRRLQNGPRAALKEVSFECDEGGLLFRGRMARYHNWQLAQETVARFDGVVQVVSEIQVVG